MKHKTRPMRTRVIAVLTTCFDSMVVAGGLEDPEIASAPTSAFVPPLPPVPHIGSVSNTCEDVHSCVL